MKSLYLNNILITKITSEYTVDEINACIFQKTGLTVLDYYLLQNGKRLSNPSLIINDVHAILRVLGGKGGFGSMLRAIGAQIEKTTNREACRDLSGRRLRDINEEKRVKTWLEKQKEREEEADEKKKKKIERMLAKPKHVFKDEHYEKEREGLTQNVGDAVEQGFKSASTSKEIGLKRKLEEDKLKKKKKKKKNTALWIGADDLGSSSDDSSNDSESENSKSSEKSTDKVSPSKITKSDDDGVSSKESTVDK